MSLPWPQRKTKLAALLKSQGDEDADGIALDRLLHGQNVIGKTSKTIEIDALRFQDKDLNVIGTLEFGQYGVIDVVTCRLNGRTYVRKSTEKRFALRARDQCFPQFERDILLQALKSESRWAPHLLCAFQTPTHLNLVMDYAEGGSLWDVLESSPHGGKLLEPDLQWWIPQIVSAIHWCHMQGFAHRDIKPQNFVLTQDAHILLIDFGSAAPLLPPASDGSQLLPKRYCLLPCGTCDYISPEILEAHEEALLALEMDDDDDVLPNRSSGDEEFGYGVETDWWSFGAMLYEMAYGFSPFFANEIRHTYQKIMNHERSLRFDESIPVPSVYKNFICKLLTHPERRIGRHNIMEITDHPLFEAVNWTNLHEQSAPKSLHLPQFTYNEQLPTQAEQFATSHYEDTLSQGFAFSALFQSSPLASSSPGLSHVRQTPMKSAMQEDPSASFIGFSWGPTRNAFPSAADTLSPPAQLDTLGTPQLTPITAPSQLSTPMLAPGNNLITTPLQRYNTFSTPNRPHAFTPFRTNTIPRTGTVRRTAQRRDLSDREAMKQLVDCVGMSARTKVLESGRKPKILNIPASLRSGYGTLRKELRFMVDPIPMPDYRSLSNASVSLSNTSSAQNPQTNSDYVNTSNPMDPSQNPNQQLPTNYAQKGNRLAPLIIDTGYGYAGSETDITDSEGPPSPSPRPGSALSVSRRSTTPTTTMTMTSTMMMTMGSSSSMLSMRSHTPTTSMSTRRLSTSGSSLLLVPPPGTARSMSFPVGSGSQVQDEGVGERRVSEEKGATVGKEVSSRKDAPGESRTPGKVSGGTRVSTESEQYEGKKMTLGDRSSVTKAPTKATQSRDRSAVFKRRNSDTVVQRRPEIRGVAEGDDYDRLEKRLDLLMGGIEDIEKKLAKAKLTLQ